MAKGWGSGQICMVIPAHWPTWVMSEAYTEAHTEQRPGDPDACASFQGARRIFHAVIAGRMKLKFDNRLSADRWKPIITR